MESKAVFSWLILEDAVATMLQPFVRKMGEAVTFPETNNSHLKMDGWKMIFPLRKMPIFRTFHAWFQGV